MDENDKALQLAKVLQRVQKGEDPRKVRYEARELLASVRLRDVTAAERYLFESGVSFQQLRELVYSFASILGDQFALLRANLPGNHIIRQVLAEHEMFECFLADLKDVNDVIQQKQELSELSSEFRKLCHTATHLQGALVHYQREDDLIFPALESSSCRSLCRIMKRVHWRIGSAIKNLIAIVYNFGVLEPEEFRLQLNALTTYLVPAMREHIFQEDNILYPIAIDALAKTDKWKRIKELCDEMVYCGFDALG